MAMPNSTENPSSTYGQNIIYIYIYNILQLLRTACLKCDGTRTETRFGLSGKRTNPFKSAGEAVHSTTGSRRVRISGSNSRCTMF